MVIDGLCLLQLLVLQLADVAERLHCRAGAVDVAARYRPARAEGREALETALAQHLPLCCALLKIDAAPGHIARQRTVEIAYRARLDGMDDGDRLLQCPALELAAHRLTDGVQPKLAHRLLELAVNTVHITAPVGGDAVFPGGEWRVVDNGVVVNGDDTGCRAVHRQLLVNRMQGAVGVAAMKNGVDDFPHLVQPLFDTLKLVQLAVGRCQFEPRACR